jgi:hypothetical protein
MEEGTMKKSTPVPPVGFVDGFNMGRKMAADTPQLASARVPVNAYAYLVGLLTGLRTGWKTKGQWEDATSEVRRGLHADLDGRLGL